jgi:beta-lactamase class A
MLRKNCAKALGVFLLDPGSQIWHPANLRLANGHVKSTSMLSVDVTNGLHEELEALAVRNKARAIGVALHDLETGFRFSLRGDRWFHAASTIKVAVLLAVFRAADEGRFRLDDSLHVRNRFFSVADGSLFRLSQDRDATPELYSAIGRTVKISSLAHAMICGSSNLASNLLLEFVGVQYARMVLREAQVDGVELRRGVEDHGAHEQGINNEATADGLLSLLSAIRSDFLTPESKQQVIRILLEQRFNSMIPAGLPPHAIVAHKTGEISTACHDIGIIYLPEREPYITAILTEFDPEREGRREMVAAISEAIYRSVLRTEPTPDED